MKYTKMTVEELQQSIKIVESLSGTYDMDSSEFYDALNMVMELAKRTMRILSAEHNNED